MSKHLEMVKVVFIRDTSITIPSPMVVRVGDIRNMPRWCAETLMEAGDCREYGTKAKAISGPTEDKAHIPVVANKNAIDLAEKHEVDLSLVEGTGFAGRITKADVKKYIDSL